MSISVCPSIRMTAGGTLFALTLFAAASSASVALAGAQQTPTPARAPRPASGARPAPDAPSAPDAPPALLSGQFARNFDDFFSTARAFSNDGFETERHVQDPADSAYRDARSLLNRGEWRKSAQAFAQIAQRQPPSAYASDALYWQAFALYRIGGVTELREALAALDARKSRFPRASNADEADVLATRVSGALVARGDNSAATRVRAAADAGTSTCDTEEISVRSSALSTLMRNDPDAAAPLLLKVLQRRDECSVSLRKSAVMMIGTKGDPSAKAKLAEVAKNDPSPSVRADAIGFLARVSGDEVVATLESVMNADTSSTVQRAAVRALGAHESVKARAAIRTLVERATAPEQLRLEAISTFDRNDGLFSCFGDGCFGGMPSGFSYTTPPTAPTVPPAPPAPSIPPTLPSGAGYSYTPAPAVVSTNTAMFTNTVVSTNMRWSNDNSDRRISSDDAAWMRGVYPRLESTRLKSRAAAVLARATDEPTITWLTALVQREEEPGDVRATVLSRIGRDLTIAALNRLYDGAASRTVRQQIVEVLGYRKEPESTDKLIEIVRTGTDPQLRRAAISALSNKKDPRTTQLLLDLIGR